MDTKSGMGTSLLYATLLLWVTSLLALAEGHKHDHKHGDTAKWKEVPIQDKDFYGDKEHLQEHFKDQPYMNVDKMTPGDTHIAYFRAHDTDNDGCLDGLELIEAYWHSASGHTDRDEWVQEMVEAGLDVRQALDDYSRSVIRSTDDTLKHLDRNHDGYIDFPEYVYDTPYKSDYWADDNTLLGDL